MTTATPEAPNHNQADQEVLQAWQQEDLSAEDRKALDELTSDLERNAISDRRIEDVAARVTGETAEVKHIPVTDESTKTVEWQVPINLDERRKPHAPAQRAFSGYRGRGGARLTSGRIESPYGPNHAR